MPEHGILNHLAAARQRRGLGVAALAHQVGVSRQTIYAMEAGEYVPNTAVALRLARALEIPVEELFALADEPPSVPDEVVDWLGSVEPHAGLPVRLCRVGTHQMAVSASAAPYFLPRADGVVAEGGAQPRVRVLDDDPDRLRLLVAGCDPALSVLARHAAEAGVDVVLAAANSSQALTWLRQGRVHVAGSHLVNEVTGEADRLTLRKALGRAEAAVVTFAEWEEGLVVAAGNGKRIRSAADLARPDIRWVGREPGSGARRLLDRLLREAGATSVPERVATGHLSAVWMVAQNLADCCLATRAAARAFGLEFLPVRRERFDLVLQRDLLATPAAARLLDVLSRARLRRELEALGGYETARTGQEVT